MQNETLPRGYWVEAEFAIKSRRLMAYGVWHIDTAGARTLKRSFSTNRKGGWEVALYLANTLRDDLNGGILAYVEYLAGRKVEAWTASRIAAMKKRTP